MATLVTPKSPENDAFKVILRWGRRGRCVNPAFFSRCASGTIEGDSFLQAWCLPILWPLGLDECIRPCTAYVHWTDRQQLSGHGS